MTREIIIHLRMTGDLADTVQAVADARFEGNRSAAIRWMLGQSLLTPEVANELMRQERETAKE